MARLVAALLLLAFACGGEWWNAQDGSWIAQGGSWIAQGAMAFSKLGEVRADQLPPEARQTLALIRKGGPFPHAKDGAFFGNREGLLPKKPRGYYREYTVTTPGSRDRGARRIIAGHGTGAVQHGTGAVQHGTGAVQHGTGAVQAGGEFYYTDDHYRSFRRIHE